MDAGTQKASPARLTPNAGSKSPRREPSPDGGSIRTPEPSSSDPMPKSGSRGEPPVLPILGGIERVENHSGKEMGRSTTGMVTLKIHNPELTSLIDTSPPSVMTSHARGSSRVPSGATHQP